MSDTQAGAVSVTGQPAPVPSPAARVQNAVALLGNMKPASSEPAQAAAPKPEPEPKPAPTFKDAVTKMRQEREQRYRQQEQEAQYVAENRQLKAQLDEVRAHGSFEDDPVGYAKSRKWSAEDQLTYAKALLFDLRPDQADPDFRIKMFEQKQAREKAKERAEQEAAAQRQGQETAQQEFQRYTTSMEEAVMSFDAGSYPESEAWYGDDVQSYLRDMLTTAAKMAEEGNRSRQVVDIRPQAVAAKLEADMAAKAAARDKRRSMRAPSEPAGQQVQSDSVADAEQSVIDTTSSKNLSGGGAPLPPARTEKERIERALAVGWRTR